MRLSTFAHCLESVLLDGGFQKGKGIFTDKPEELSYKIPFRRDSLTAMYVVLADLPFNDGEVKNYGAFEASDITRWYNYRANIQNSSKVSVLNQAGWEEVWMRTERGQARGWDVVLSKYERNDFFVSHLHRNEDHLCESLAKSNATYLSDSKVLQAIEKMIAQDTQAPTQAYR